MGGIIAREIVGAQKVADFHLDKGRLGVVNDIALVHEHDYSGNANLTSEQNVLAGLLKGTVGSCNNRIAPSI